MRESDQVARAPQLTEVFDLASLAFVGPMIDRMLHDGIVVQNAASQMVYFNDKALELLRMTADELSGSSSLDPRWQSITIDGDPYPGERHPAYVVLQTGEDQRGELMGVRVGDESLRWLSIDSSAVDTESGRYSVTVFTDVTDEFDSHRALRHAHDEIQSQLIQRDLPRHDRVKFASSYRSTGASRTIGGDFLGVHPTGPDRFALFIGDVCGHGMAAAGLSSIARNSMRALGGVIDDPSDLLGRLHDIVEAERPDQFVTSIAGTLDVPPSGAARLRFACGGHPHPILIRAGEATPIGETGPLVGMVANRPRPVTEVVLQPGDRVLIYTDGVLDAGTPRLSTPELAAQMPTTLPLDATLTWMMSLGPAQSDGVASDDATVLGFELG